MDGLDTTPTEVGSHSMDPCLSSELEVTGRPHAELEGCEEWEYVSDEQAGGMFLSLL